MPYGVFHPGPKRPKPNTGKNLGNLDGHGNTVSKPTLPLKGRKPKGR